MDNLPDFYKSFKKTEDKTAWVKLIKDNPTVAIDTYYNAFCKDNPNGYCDLFQLFQLLGILKERNRHSNNKGSQSSDTDPSNLANLDILESIKKKVDELDGAIDEQLKKQSEKKNTEYKQQIEDLRRTLEQSYYDILQDNIRGIDEEKYRYETEIADLKKDLETLLDIQNRASEVAGNDTDTNTDKITNQSIQDKEKEIQQLKQEHESNVAKLSKQIETLKETQKNKEDEYNKSSPEPAEEIKKLRQEIDTLRQEKIGNSSDDVNANNQKVEKINKTITTLEAKLKEIETESEKQRALNEEAQRSLQDQLGREIDRSTKKIEKLKQEQLEEERIKKEIQKKCENPEEFEKKYFELYTRAKQILHSDMLILIGCLYFYNINQTMFTAGNQDIYKGWFETLNKSLFITLTGNQYEILENTISNKENTFLNKVFTTIIERDNSNERSKNKKIMLYALLWILHFNTYIQSSDKYSEMLSNKSLFNTGKTDTTKATGGILTVDNCELFIVIQEKIEKQLKELKRLKDDITGSNNAEFITLKDQYNRIIQEKKSLLTILKRRDDWYTETTYKHPRFDLDFKDANTTINEPLKLTYNNTPLEIETKEVTNNDKNNNKTHEYKFYGFDKVYQPQRSNEDIAQNLYTTYLKDNLDPQCFIGYGQSGSGKTSTLIYLDVPGMEQDGIIMELLKKLDPYTVTVSMIEIYEAEAAELSDKSCIGIGTSNHPNKGKIVQCNALNTDEGKKSEDDQKGGQVKERIPVRNYGQGLIETEPDTTAMRHITIGEILDKHYDDKLGKLRPNNEKDQYKQTIFEKKTVQCFKERHGKEGWFYTHNNKTGEHCMDKDFGLKHYILMGFECREIAPTSNNKQSSRSHVIVSLKLEWNGTEKKPRYIYVCDLAGVENEFDCETPASTDIIRMKAKVKANKNYSNIVVPGKIEAWNDLKEKRAGNIVKYVHKDVHISKTVSGPTCWPDGTPNEAGDIDALRLENSTELLKIFWHITQRTNEKIMTLDYKGKKITASHDSLGKTRINIPKTAKFKGNIVNYFEEKLKKLPIKKDDKGNIIGFEKVEEKIRQFIDIKYDDGTAYSFVKFLHGSKKFTKIELENLTLSELRRIEQENTAARNQATISVPIELLETAFDSIEMPDCATSYEKGFEEACKIRSREGKVINNTLAQLSLDVKRISKYAIKERLKTMRNPEQQSVSENAETIPCLFADPYDDYSHYSMSANPLMNWYDIDDPHGKDFGSILSAVCILNNPNERWEDPIEKLKFLQTVRFNYCTVLNETYVAKDNKGDYLKTPAGKPIYVNNHPTPPYINVSKLENTYKKYIFNQYNPNPNANYSSEFVNEFLKLIIQLLRHAEYEKTAIEILIILKKAKKTEDKSLFELENRQQFDFIIDRCKYLINYIKKNNNATFIGTIQTTEEINRVSEKILISEELFNDSTESDKLLQQITANLTTTERGNISFIHNLEKITQILNSQDKHYLKCKTKKQKDIDSMITSVETAFPYMARFIDEDKLGYIWFLINNGYNTTNQERMDAAINRYIDEKTTPDHEKARKINVWFKNNNYRILTNSENAQREFNKKIIDNLKNQPSLEYLETKKLGIRRPNIIDILVDRNNELTVNKQEAEWMKETFIHQLGTNGYKPSLMNILSTDEFTTNVYREYVYETAFQSGWNNNTNSFDKFTPFPLSEFRSKLNKGKYEIVNQSNRTQIGGNRQSAEITTKIDTMIGKIKGLDGISQPKDPPKYLAEINNALDELEENLTELYSGNDSISTKLQEALQQLEDARSSNTTKN